MRRRVTGPSAVAVLLACAAAAAVLAGGCGSSGSSPGTGAAVTTAATATAGAPSALAPAVTVAPAPAKKASTSPPQAANGAPRATTVPRDAAAYAAALVALSRELDTAIDAARASGSSAKIAATLKRITALASAWTKAGNAIGGGSALLDAGQTAVSAVETPLLLDEAHRQVAAARAALGG